MLFVAHSRPSGASGAGIIVSKDTFGIAARDYFLSFKRGVPMLPTRRIEICGWSPQWPEKFRLKATAIRQALGDRAFRIDHIGSTAVQGLSAKPIIDIQVSVAEFEPIEALAAPLESIGYLWRSANPELTKRYFRERPGDEGTHIHVRRFGSWHEQWALLFRDYMRVRTRSMLPTPH